MVDENAAADGELFARSTELPSACSETGSPLASAPDPAGHGSSELDRSSSEPGAEVATGGAPGAARRDAAGTPEAVRWLHPDGERYSPREPLGRGGMGEVLLCRDHAVGRDVAMKVIRDRQRESRPDVRKRFVHEARVQGLLEHPAIVPVYDVGLNAEGSLYFTMKHVRGVSLSVVLRGLRGADPDMAARYSRRRLLTLFSQICMAVHFAHEKGVVHRDLKPSNIMLGAFGEAYVLDWGIAVVRGAGDEPPGSPEERPLGLGAQPLGGPIMGTPGYMAPEQIDPARVREGDAGDGAPSIAAAATAVDARADVYALGAILFELLTLERMHAEGTLTEVLRSTLETDGARPAARAPRREIPPELDHLCYRATRRDRSARVPSAHELSLAVEAFLDGDRDLVLRRQLAVGHALNAEQALARAGSANAAETEQSERARAMREVAAALGLDTNHHGARQTLVRLIAEPLRSVPAQAAAQLRASSLAAYRLTGRAALIFYACYLLYLPLLLWMGIRDLGLFALGWATIAACASVTYVLLRHPPARLDMPLLHLAVSTFTVGTVSVLFGPFVLVPMLALAMCVSYTASVGHARGLVPIASCLAVVVPAVLGWLGVIPKGYAFEAGRWIILPTVFHISPLATQVFLLIATVGTLAPACILVARLRRAYLDAERKLALQAWQLRQIVPEAP